LDELSYKTAAQIIKSYVEKFPYLEDFKAIFRTLSRNCAQGIYKEIFEQLHKQCLLCGGLGHEA
jgi:hypothetical protein